MRWILAALFGFALVWGLTHIAWAQNTNPPEIQKWFRELTNRMGGSCCGEADAYPAVVTKTPSCITPPTSTYGQCENYRPDGEVCITDPSAKQVMVEGVLVKSRPEYRGPKCLRFSWMKMTREKYGNPMDTAIVFVPSTVAMGAGDDSVYCVAILPNIY
jgi:hypothetical protein